MARTHTFNPIDLGRVLSRPVCSRSSSCSAFTNPAYKKHYRSRSVGRGAPSAWSMCCIAPARRELHVTPIGRFFSVSRWTLPIYGALHIVPMLVFKRKAVARTQVPMILREFGYHAQCHVPGHVRRHIPRCGRTRVSPLSTVILFWLIY